MSAAGLVGRDTTLDTLSGMIGHAGGSGNAVLLVGERGIGKSACLRAAEDFARTAKYRLLETVGSQAESDLPYAGLHRLLRPLLAMVSALPAVQRRALLTALGSQDGPPPNLLVVSLATLDLVSQACEHTPLLITADDLHWLDEESRQVLTFLARRLYQTRASILASASWIRPAPEAAGAFREISLERLDDVSADDLVRGRAPDLDDAHREWVVREAVGNPLALAELATLARSIDLPRTDPFSMIVPLSPALHEAFSARLHELPALNRDAVLVAALAAENSLQEILAATAVLSGKPATPAVLEAAQSLGLLGFDDHAVYFAHPLVRSAVALSESVSRRQAAHTALGAAVTISSYRRTWHRASGAAGSDEEIAADLEASSAESIRRGDGPGALLALRRAAQLSPKPAEAGRRHLLAAKHAGDLGQLGTAEQLLASALAGELSEADQMRGYLLRVRLDGVRAGGSERVQRLCAMATRAAAAGDDRLALELSYEAALHSYLAPVNAQAAAALAVLARTAERSWEDPLALSVLALADPVRHGRAVVATLAAIDEEALRDPDALRAYAAAAYAVGDYACCSDFLSRAEVLLTHSGMLGARKRLQQLSAAIGLDLGDWGSAHLAGGAEVRAKAAALRGDATMALALAVEAEHAPGARRGSLDLTGAQIVRGIAYISLGRHADAYLALSRVFDRDDPSYHVREQCAALGYLVEAAVRGGHRDDAGTIVARMEALGAVTGWPLLLVQLRYARAVLADDEDAERLFVESLAADPGEWPWPRARTHLAFGRWLRRRRQVSRSRGPLQDAHAACQRIGATWWAQEAMDELEATGQRSEEPSDEDPLTALSAQEQKIARLVAQGLSNTQIGERLGLSPRTVGSHLYRIFPKLGISARSQIAASRRPTRPRRS